MTILRIFATDGYTPEKLFRWSVEETAEHLCEQQLLWVTKFSGPWKPLVDWFVKQRVCRGVVLDPADRWEWNREHEITWRIAQALHYGASEHPDAVCWIHDDMAPPQCDGFKACVRSWLASESAAMAAPCYQLWDDFETVRADQVGFSFAGDIHCWLAKWSPDLQWIMEPGGPYRPDRSPDRFITFNPLHADTLVSPYPFRHAKGVVKSFREHEGFVRRGFPTDRWKNAEGVRCLPYRSGETWQEFEARVKA